MLSTLAVEENLIEQSARRLLSTVLKASIGSSNNLDTD